MNVVGRQMARSSSTAHHQRQYSDNFLDDSFNSKWLQSSNIHSSQDFGFCGGVRMNKKSPDTGTPSICSLKNNEEYVSPSDLIPGLLDLHSFDTELLPEDPIVYEGYGLQKPVRGKTFDDFERYLAIDKLPNRSRGNAENNVLKSISLDKERANSVAKIKVVVRKRPLNKKEIAKKEEDVITNKDLGV